MKLLRIVLNGEEHPNYTITKVFEKEFDCTTIWWEQHDERVLNQHILEVSRSKDFDVVFMQIQRDHVIQPETAKILAENRLVFNWTGDVRENLSAFTRIGSHTISLFTNTTDVLKMKNNGYEADYLQVGFDCSYYYPEKREKHNNIVFCANNYPNEFPLSNYRLNIVQFLKREFQDRFNLYGRNWEKDFLHSEKPFTTNWEEAEIYRTASIAINCSHFNYGRYSSDRLFREMACGAFVLSHKYENIEADFKDGYHLVTFSDIPDLIEKCHYYLSNPAEAELIAKNGSELVRANFTWENFVQNFKLLIKKYQNVRA